MCVNLGAPPLWRMACWSSHSILNLGLSTSIRYYHLTSSSSLLSVCLINSWTRSLLGYTDSDSDLLSTISLSPQLTFAINVELLNNRHIIDLEQSNGGYILNLRLLIDESYLVLIRTPKEIDIDELNWIEQDEEEQSKSQRKRKIIGKLPENLLLEIYKILEKFKQN